MSQQQPSHGAVPSPSDPQSSRGYGAHASTGVSDFAHNPAAAASPLSQSTAQREDADSIQYGSSVIGDGDQRRNRSASSASTAVQTSAPARSNTLKKKGTVSRSASTKSLKHSASKKSLNAGTIKAGASRHNDENYNNVFHTPIPTTSSPTEILANRFQAWRQLLKSLITYFREVQDSYDARAKAVRKVQSTIANITSPSVFISHNGINEATRMLDDYHKRSVAEASKSRDIEIDVIGALTGLRSDLGQKIKEIKSLSGDFKNSVDKEKENTRREVAKLQDALQHVDHEDGTATGKNDPFVVRLAVDKSVERQIDEENYLHRAYLNLENSGRELESIVVGEIQKAYNALASILKREADDAYHVVDGLRTGPIAMPKDQEWLDFVTSDPHFIDPSVPVRRIEDIQYPGKHDPAASEVRAGMLERKSKYLKSYTPGWYVLSPTHLHEFKSADKIYTQPPVMSLYLLDQKLGSKSEPGSSSHKFMLKGKQSGGMHKGHQWVFRAESYDTMQAWYEDIRVLTESTGEQRTAFVRKHAKSVSSYSERATLSSDGMEDDEADAAPYSADATSLKETPQQEDRLQRPQPGGRFPSDINTSRTAPLSPSSGSSEPDRDLLIAAAAVPGTGSTQRGYESLGQDPYHMSGIPSGSRVASYNDPDQSLEKEMLEQPQPDTYQPSYDAAAAPAQNQTYFASTQQRAQPQYEQQAQNYYTEPAQPYYEQQSSYPTFQQPVTPQQPQQSFSGGNPSVPSDSQDRPQSNYGEWLAPVAVGAAGVGAGALGTEAYRRHQHEAAVPTAEEQRAPVSPLAEDVPTPLASDVHGEGPSVLASYNNPASTSAPERATAAIAAPMGGDMAPPPTPGQSADHDLGGLESKGAHETRAFPFVRHDTDMSVSALHVPGEFPKRT